MNTDKNKRIEDILNSLDGSHRAAAPDFFYTRLKARMEPAVKPSWILRPVFALAGLVVVLLVNAAVILAGDAASENTAVADTESIQSIAAEYRLNDNSYVYDLNQEK